MRCMTSATASPIRSAENAPGTAESRIDRMSSVRVMQLWSSVITGSIWRGGSVVVVRLERIRDMIRSPQRAEPDATSSSLSDAAWKARNTGWYRS